MTYRQIRIMHSYSDQVGMEISGIETKNDYILVAADDGTVENQEVCYDMYFLEDGRSIIKHFIGGMLYDVYTFDSEYKDLPERYR